MESEYLDHIKDLQGQLARGEMRLADVPGYQPGFGPNPGHWHQTDYQDLYQKVYGRPSGSMGIGRLREVALTEITPNEANHPMYAEDPSFFHKWSIPYDQLDVSRIRDQSAEYQARLEEAGVKVHRVESPIHR